MEEWVQHSVEYHGKKFSDVKMSSMASERMVVLYPWILRLT